MTNPILSLVIPIYNAERYLRKTLDSIVSQDGAADCEIILINDGSTDNSLEIAEEYSVKYGNIRIISKANEGVSATRNHGIECACGNYILFVDADDILHPAALMKILVELRDSVPDIIVWKYLAFYTHPRFAKVENTVFRIVDNSDKRAFNFLSKRGCAVSLCTKAIRRSLFLSNKIRFMPSMSYDEDMFVSWKCILAANDIRYFDAPLYYYRQYRNSAVSKYHANLYEKYKMAFDNLRSFVNQYGLSSEKLLEDMDFHFAGRLFPLVLMECRAPYNENERKERLLSIIQDTSIHHALEISENLNAPIYNYARNNDVDGMMKYVRKAILKERILYPIKRILK